MILSARRRADEREGLGARSARHRGQREAGQLVAPVGREGREGLLQLRLDLSPDVLRARFPAPDATPPVTQRPRGARSPYEILFGPAVFEPPAPGNYFRASAWPLVLGTSGVNDNPIPENKIASSPVVRTYLGLMAVW